MRRWPPPEDRPAPWDPAAGTPLRARWGYVLLLAGLLAAWAALALLVLHYVPLALDHDAAHRRTHPGHRDQDPALGALALAVWLPMILGYATWWTLRQLFAPLSRPPWTPRSKTSRSTSSSPKTPPRASTRTS